MNNTIQPTVNITLDELFSLTPVGPLSTAIGDNLFGINHVQTSSPIPINKDHHGFVFFTRPQLNMQSENIRNVRIFTPLLTQLPTSYQRTIRCLLDPRLQIGYAGLPAYMCPFVDKEQAFFPVLTNHIKTISGWPDIEVPTYTNKEGQYKEGYSMVDGITKNFTTYDLTATFRNSRGNLILSLFSYWAHYMANVFEGLLMPYPDFIVDNMIDYNTRIYRIILDETKTKVQHIASTGASFPTAVSLGGIFDFDNTKPYNESNAEFSIPFRCMGASYNDDINVYTFNRTVQIFNLSMRDQNRERDMVLVPADISPIFKNRVYPRINPSNYTLEWWVTKQLYENKRNALAAIDSNLFN